MSKEIADDVEVPMFCCGKGKYIGRVPKTMNLDGHCPDDVQQLR